MLRSEATLRKIKSPATTIVTCHIQEPNEEKLLPTTKHIM